MFKKTRKISAVLLAAALLVSNTGMTVMAEEGDMEPTTVSQDMPEVSENEAEGDDEEVSIEAVEDEAPEVLKAARPGNVIKSGYCGSKTANARWELRDVGPYDNGYALYITGSNNTKWYDSAESTPWAEYRGNITYIEVGEGIKSIGSYNFSECGKDNAKRLKVSLPEGLELIEEGAFRGCTGLYNIYIPANLRYVGDNAFMDCSNLGGIGFYGDGYSEDHAISIRNNAFAGCIKMTWLSLPRYFRQFGTNAFGESDKYAECKFTDGIYVDKDCLCYNGSAWVEPTDGYIFNKIKDAGGYIQSTLKIDQGTKKFYFGEGGSDAIVYYEYDYDYLVRGRIIKITGTGKMRSFDSREEYPWNDPDNPWGIDLVIVDTKNVGKYAFQNSPDLFRVSLGNNMEEVEEAAFENCTKLNGVDPGGSSVTLGNRAFKGCTALFKLYDDAWAYGTTKEVDITSHFLSIGDNAFEGCTAIEKLRSSDNKVRIGNNAFKDCTGLTALTLGSGVILNGTGAFSGCTGIKSLKMNSAYNSNIPSKSFEGCTALESASISLGSGAVNPNAFEGCSSLKDLTVSFVSAIKNNAFYGLPSLQEVTLGNGVKNVEEGAFRNCANLIKFDTGGAENFTQNALADCNALEEFTVGSAAKTLGVPVNMTPGGMNLLRKLEVKATSTAYKSDDGKKMILDAEGTTLIMGTKDVNVIPAEVTDIGDYAFFGLSKMTGVTLPLSLVSIGGYAFNGCTGLNKKDAVRYMASLEEWKKVTVKKGNDVIKTENIKFRQIKGKIEGKLEWEVTDKTLTITPIPGNTEIPDFEKDSAPWAESAGLIEVVQAAGFDKVGKYAFTNFINVTTDNFNFGSPPNITSVGDYSFMGCEALTEPVGKDSLTYVGAHAFDSCSGITEVKLTVAETIGDYAFTNCMDLKTVELPSTLTTLGNYAFSDCINPNFTTVNIPSSLETIGEGAFAGCPGLKSFVAEAPHTHYHSNTDGTVLMADSGPIVAVCNVETIDLGSDSPGIINPGAFKGLTNLKKVIFSDTHPVTQIRDRAFEGCSSLEEINLYEGLSYIGHYAFSGCSNLKDINIPSTIATIGIEAFKDCTTLTTFTVPKATEYVGEGFIAGCSGIKTLTVSDENTNYKDYGKNVVVETKGNNYYLFAGCGGSTGIPEGVKEIKKYAFCGCNGITALEIPSTVNKI